MMNSARAVWVGLAIGLLAGLAPSCGKKCGPQNCGGCCSAQDTCVFKPNNTNNTTCGEGGGLCADCTKSSTVCDPLHLVCTDGSQPVDSGTKLDGGQTSCTGCLLPTGVCASGTSAANCGVHGAACVTCPVGQLCNAGACQTPVVTHAVGDACLSDQECQFSLGPTAVCKQTTSSGNAVYTSGYCTLPCKNVGCPDGGLCVSLDPRYGEADTVCWDICGVGDPCRQPGYSCYPFGAVKACWLSPLPSQDAGPPADKVGRACEADTTCQYPPDRLGICMTRDLNRAWPQGYCSKSFCEGNDECAADGGAACLTFSPGPGQTGTRARCIARCGVATPPDGGQADCRAGYLCTGVPLADGGTSNTNYCLPPLAGPPERTGQSCADAGECVQPTTTIADCIGERTTLADGGSGQSGFPGGYCSRFGCAVDGECAPDGGGACLAALGGTACFQRCPEPSAGQSTCRTGYVCAGFDAGFSGVTGYCAPACWAPGNSCGSGTCGDAGYCL